LWELLCPLKLAYFSSNNVACFSSISLFRHVTLLPKRIFNNGTLGALPLILDYLHVELEK
jgi:hypothetical protein